MMFDQQIGNIVKATTWDRQEIRDRESRVIKTYVALYLASPNLITGFQHYTVKHCHRAFLVLATTCDAPFS